MAHLTATGTCKCGLQCPFRLEEKFNFDPTILGLPDHPSHCDGSSKHPCRLHHASRSPPTGGYAALSPGETSFQTKTSRSKFVKPAVRKIDLDSDSKAIESLIAARRVEVDVKKLLTPAKPALPSVLAPTASYISLDQFLRCADGGSQPRYPMSGLQGLNVGAVLSSLKEQESRHDACQAAIASVNKCWESVGSSESKAASMDTEKTLPSCVREAKCLQCKEEEEEEESVMVDRGESGAGQRSGGGERLQVSIPLTGTGDSDIRGSAGTAPPFKDGLTPTQGKGCDEGEPDSRSGEPHPSSGEPDQGVEGDSSVTLSASSDSLRSSMASPGREGKDAAALLASSQEQRPAIGMKISSEQQSNSLGSSNPSLTFNPVGIHSDTCTGVSGAKKVAMAPSAPLSQSPLKLQLAITRVQSSLLPPPPGLDSSPQKMPVGTASSSQTSGPTGPQAEPVQCPGAEPHPCDLPVTPPPSLTPPSSPLHPPKSLMVSISRSAVCITRHSLLECWHPGSFSPGDIVWAKAPLLPAWPGMVISHADWKQDTLDPAPDGMVQQLLVSAVCC